MCLPIFFSFFFFVALSNGEILNDSLWISSSTSKLSSFKLRSPFKSFVVWESKHEIIKVASLC